MKTMNHRDTETQRDALTEQIIGAAIEVHRALGPGLLESAYQECLCIELGLRGVRFKSQVELPVFYKEHHADVGYRLDLVIDDAVVVEIKAVEHLLPVHEAQLLTYLRLSGIATGLLLNFNVPVLKDGIRRMKI
jgi:GxxExxY protein